MWNLKYDTNELVSKKETDPQTHRQGQHTCGCQGGGVGEGSTGNLQLADVNCYM